MPEYNETLSGYDKGLKKWSDEKMIDECYLRVANLSDCRRYRYALVHYWGADPYNQDESELCVFIGLNPSTADAFADDPTILRCVDFAKRWGFLGLAMVNVFGFRETDPKKMLKAPDPIGPENDQVLHNVRGFAKIVAAWGNHCPVAREQQIAKIFEGQELFCLGTNQNGSPRHPLYIPAEQVLVPYQWRKENSLFEES